MSARGPPFIATAGGGRDGKRPELSLVGRVVRANLPAELLDERGAERDGLAGARAATAEDVLAGDHVGDRRRLDRERAAGAELLQGAGDVAADAEVAQVVGRFAHATESAIDRAGIRGELLAEAKEALAAARGIDETARATLAALADHVTDRSA